MTNETDKAIEAVAKLIEKTHEDEILWEPTEPPDQHASDAFVTTYKDQKLRIYRTRAAANARLEMLDFTGRPVWSFPATAAIDDLVAAVQHQHLGVRAFLNRILSDD